MSVFRCISYFRVNVREEELECRGWFVRLADGRFVVSGVFMPRSLRIIVYDDNLSLFHCDVFVEVDLECHNNYC